MMRALWSRCFWYVWFSFGPSWFGYYIFIKKTLIDFCSSLKKIWFLKLEAWNWKLEILNLKLEIWKFATWDFETWNLEFETWGFEFLYLKIWNLIWNLKFETWNFETWDFENLQLEILKLVILENGIWDLEFEI